MSDMVHTCKQKSTEYCGVWTKYGNLFEEVGFANNLSFSLYAILTTLQKDEVKFKRVSTDKTSVLL